MILERNNQLDEFLKENENKDCIVLPILSDIKKHPKENSLCAIYIKILNGQEGMVCFNHGETLSIGLDNLISLDMLGKIYCYNKKELSHIVKLTNVVDVNLQHYMSKNKPLEWEELSTKSHDYFNRTMWKFKNINRIIPIWKHIELCRIKTKVLEKYIDLPIHQEYNDEILDNLTYIESNGLQTTNGMVYSEYNPYTSTGRPSNRFGGINFAALNKKDGSRKPFVSRFDDGMLVEFDYDAYHLRLIGEVVNYKFPDGSVHEHMSEFYGCDYQESKNRSFQYLYGHIPPEIVETNPFFDKVNQYINYTWIQYKERKFIESDIYNKKIYKKNLSAMNRNKVFNYMIQLMETENNMKVLTQLIPFLKDFESKLILYSYDSFLFDFKISDGLEFLKGVKNILEQDGKFPTKSGKGLNYHEMVNITEKL